MDVTLEMALRCGACYEVRGPEAKMRRLKIALARKMASGSSETMDVHGHAHQGGKRHPVDVTVACDQLAGVKLTSGACAANDAGSSDAPTVGTAGE
jgi:hypothetical protein